MNNNHNNYQYHQQQEQNLQARSIHHQILNNNTHF